MSDKFYVVSETEHNALVEAAYRHRGFSADEAAGGAKLCAEASRHGIRTHNALKALHLDHLFGTGSQGCVPNVEIEEKPSRFAASKIWNANRKLGQATAYAAMEEAIRLADEYGVGMVSVDNAFHYLWGGGYVMEAAKRGYIAYTNCTAALAEVVPFGGKFPTLGTNPHSWGLPTSDAVGFPIVIDWATSVVAMGRVQQFAREGLELPPNAAVDADGNPTTVPTSAAPCPPSATAGIKLAKAKRAPAVSSSKFGTPMRCRAAISPKGVRSRTTSKRFSVTFSVTAMRTAFSPVSSKPKRPNSVSNTVDSSLAKPK